MNIKTGTLAAAVLLTLTVGCTPDADRESSVAVDGRNGNVINPEVAPATAPGPLTAQAWVDDFSLGKELTSEGAIANEEDAFVAGERVHLGMTVEDAPDGVAVTVRWYGPDEALLGDETKMVSGQDRISFERETRQLKEGDYRAEVWVGSEKVNEQHFQIVSANA